MSKYSLALNQNTEALSNGADFNKSPEEIFDRLNNANNVTSKLLDEAEANEDKQKTIFSIKKLNYRQLKEDAKERTQKFVSDCEQLQPFKDKILTFDRIEVNKKIETFSIYIKTNGEAFNITKDLGQLIRKYYNDDYRYCTVTFDDINSYQFEYLEYLSNRAIRREEFAKNLAIAREQNQLEQIKVDNIELNSIGYPHCFFITNTRNFYLLNLNSYSMERLGLLEWLFNKANQISFNCVELDTGFLVQGLYKTTKLMEASEYNDATQVKQWYAREAKYKYDDVTFEYTENYAGVEGLSRVSFLLNKNDWQVVTNWKYTI